MHVDADSSSESLPPGVPWYKLLNRYHWFVFVVAALGWLFDCLDQQLFVLARPAAMKELLKGAVPETEMKAHIDLWGNIATSVFIAGWASGGLVFGMLGDRIGRTKTMMFTILIYSACTGLSALSTSVYDFAFYRFLTGLGVGGEFAVGVALISEVMPAAARPYALASLQALSAVGNISAAGINWGLNNVDEQGLPSSPWRVMFMIGALPALLALVIRLKLKEPEAWKKASREEDVTKKQLGSYRELFSTPILRKHAILGLILACSGVVGLWGIAFYAPDLINSVQTPKVTDTLYTQAIAAAEGEEAAALTRVHEAIKAKTTTKLTGSDKELHDKMESQIRGKVSNYTSLTSVATNVGAFFGMYGFGLLAQRIGRKKTFAIALLASFVITVFVFYTLTDMWQIAVFVPIMGFCQLSLFAGYAIYLPELFPTRLRSTGTSFCYNVGRFAAATGPLVKIPLTNFFRDTLGFAEPLRPAGMAMCGVFLIGLLVLPFLPETKGKPLPE